MSNHTKRLGDLIDQMQGGMTGIWGNHASASGDATPAQANVDAVVYLANSIRHGLLEIALAIRNPR